MKKKTEKIIKWIWAIMALIVIGYSLYSLIIKSGVLA